MPLATAGQYRAMLDTARSGGFAYPAVNVTSSQTLNAALRGFADARSDGIVQITTGAAAYLSGPANDMAEGAHAFAEFAHVVAGRAPVLIALHTDHCTPEHVDDFLRPLLRESKRRRDRGQPPLFNSHMFDGSQLPLADNLRISAELLRETDDLDVVLELEIGTVGGEEDGIDHERVPRERLYTTAADALAVADALGTGERGRYLLAATFGNVHGHYAPGNVKLRPELLAELQHALESRSGARNRFEFVFHGGSGSSPAEIRKAIGNGVVKMNLDTDLQYAFSRSVEEHFDGSRDAGRDGVDKRLYDPRAWGRKAEAAMAERVVRACEVLSSSGRSIARAEPPVIA
ncbi:MAG TPA: class II fructose-bisphosphate aldolase [Gaiellaceae bacterium]|nr:class II fructose-bisphosphate aldolase [Gaiellaceae bacterium]